MATVWIVLRRATESALRMRVSIWASEGNLTKMLSIDTFDVAVFKIALLMTPPATTLLLTKLDELPPVSTLKSALGKFPLVITPPETMFDEPLLVDVTRTAPVPMLDNPDPDDSPLAPEESPPREVTAKSDTPLSLAPPAAPEEPPTKTDGSDVIKDDPPVDDPEEV